MQVVEQLTDINSFLPVYHFIFDVESIGLHGDGFAAGLVVYDQHWMLQEECSWVAPPELAQGTDEDRKWIHTNVIQALQKAGLPLETNCTSISELRQQFLDRWLFWKNKNASMYADCIWPVEANFLSACIRDAQVRGMPDASWLGPYPLLDIMTFERAARLPTAQTLQRDTGLYPLHHPLADAQFSALRLRRFLSRLATQTS